MGYFNFGSFKNKNKSFNIGFIFLVKFSFSSLSSSPSSSDLSSTRKMWRGVWSLRIPNRVKTLLWRAGSDALPSKANLLKRRILSDASCPGCNIENESSFHALWSCPCLLPIWNSHFGWLIKKAHNCSSMLDLFFLCQEKSNALELFAMTAALIWARRNQIRLGEVSVPIDRISTLAVDNLLEFQRATSLPLRPPPPSVLLAGLLLPRVGLRSILMVLPFLPKIWLVWELSFATTKVLLWLPSHNLFPCLLL